MITELLNAHPVYHVSLLLQLAEAQGAHLARSLKVGDVFLGAIPTAVSLGYEPGTTLYRMFRDAYIANLPKQIRIDRENRIVALGELP